MLPIIIKDKAVEDLQKAYIYLEEQEKHLGEKLLKYLDEYAEIIQINPYLFGEDYKTIRQVRIKPFKYILRYKIYKEYIAIIQLFHSQQHPKKKTIK